MLMRVYLGKVLLVYEVMCCEVMPQKLTPAAQSKCKRDAVFHSSQISQPSY